MSVVVAYQETAVGNLALKEAAKEANLRETSLTVVNVPEAVDIDVVEANKQRLSNEIAEVLREGNVGLWGHDVNWTLQVITAEDAAEAVLDLVASTDAELLVVGARRRSRVGKLLMGSVTQTIILDAHIPVLVVKTPASEK
jgi:nucleotide-binding universal stress UspA family protein